MIAKILQQWKDKTTSLSHRNCGQKPGQKIRNEIRKVQDINKEQIFRQFQHELAKDIFQQTT